MRTEGHFFAVPASDDLLPMKLHRGTGITVVVPGDGISQIRRVNTQHVAAGREVEAPNGREYIIRRATQSSDAKECLGDGLRYVRKTGAKPRCARNSVTWSVAPDFSGVLCKKGVDGRRALPAEDRQYR